MSFRRCALLLALCAVGCVDPTVPATNQGTAVGDGEDANEADGDAEGDEQAGPSDDGEDGAGPGDGDGDQACETTLRATVRDFRAEHADFQNDAFNSNVSYPGLVLETIGDDKKPVYAASGPTPQTTGKTEFDQWYRDVPGVNEAFDVEIPLADDGTGKLVFDSQFFFPLDGKGFGSEANDANGQPRNFHFTTEIHTEFQYRGGETFTFNGDDDVWVFINGKLAIDLGGLHPKLLQSVDLDEAAARLGITPGNRYSMDIFHAERHAVDSTFRIETTIDCLVPVIL